MGVDRTLLDLVEPRRVDPYPVHSYQEELLLLPVPPAVERKLDGVPPDRGAQNGQLDRQAGLLEQLTRGGRFAALLRIETTARGEPVPVVRAGRIPAVEQQHAPRVIDEQHPGRPPRDRGGAPQPAVGHPIEGRAAISPAGGWVSSGTASV